MTLSLRTNMATPDQLSDHFRRCDDQYVPPLSERVEIDEYSRKIAARAMRFEAWSNSGLVGLVAAYLPGTSSGPVFITDVSVVPEHRGNGVASTLLDECAAFARASSITHLRLEVDRRNAPAIGLYRASGFLPVGEAGETMTMEWSVNGPGPER